jgi:hypothetical protein
MSEVGTGTTLTLTPDEAAILADLLRNDLGSLRKEVYKTEDYDWRNSLKQRESILRAILERLPPAAT